jgi:hypothetical protein
MDYYRHNQMQPLTIPRRHKSEAYLQILNSYLNPVIVVASNMSKTNFKSDKMQKLL